MLLFCCSRLSPPVDDVVRTLSTSAGFTVRRVRPPWLAGPSTDLFWPPLKLGNLSSARTALEGRQIMMRTFLQL